MRQVVLDGGPGARKGGYGLYELMHSVGDSFSGAHTQRRPGTEAIEELRIWKPLTRLPGLATEKIARIPDSAFHKWDDHRDKTYVVEDRVTVDGRRCKDLTDYPYMVPYECLSEEGDDARQAIVELLIVVRDLRVAHKDASAAAGRSAAPTRAPEQSDAWRSYKDRWFRAAYPCQGDECREHQPTDISPGSYAFLGLDTTYNFTRKFVDVTAKGTLFRYSWDLNPFVVRAVRRGRLPPLRQRRGRRPARPRGRSRAPDRKTPRDGIHSRGLARRLRRRPHRIGESRRTSSASTTSSTAVSPSRSTVRWRSTGASPPPSSPSESA